MGHRRVSCLAATTWWSPILLPVIIRRPLAALLLSVVSSLVLSTCGGGSMTEPADQSLRQRSTPWHSLMKEAGSQLDTVGRVPLKETFSILDGPPEWPSARLRSHIRRLIGAPSGALPFEHAQFVRVGESGMWFVAGDILACLAQANFGAVSCGLVSDVANNGLVLGVFTPPARPARLPRQFLVLGVVPDCASAGQAKIGGEFRTFPIRHNAYAVRADRPVSIVGFYRDVPASGRDGLASLGGGARVHSGKREASAHGDERLLVEPFAKCR